MIGFYTQRRQLVNVRNSGKFFPDIALAGEFMEAAAFYKDKIMKNNGNSTNSEKYRLHINPSSIYRVFLILLFFGEIFIFYYYYSSLTSIIIQNQWKNYLFIAILFPVILIFITSIVVDSFNAFFLREEKDEACYTSSSANNQFDHPFFSFNHFFSNIPFLLKLLLFIIAIFLCYYLIGIVLVTIDSITMLVYIIFACLFIFMILFFAYAVICMILNYQMNLKKLEFFFMTKQNIIEKDHNSSLLHDFSGLKPIDHRNQ